MKPKERIYKTKGTWADVLLSRKQLDEEVDQLAADDRVLAAMLANFLEYGDYGMICVRAFPETKSIPEKYDVHQCQIVSEFMLRFNDPRALRGISTSRLRTQFPEFFRHESSVKRKG